MLLSSLKISKPDTVIAERLCVSSFSHNYIMHSQPGEEKLILVILISVIVTCEVALTAIAFIRRVD